MVVSRLFVAFIVCLVILPSLNDVRQAHCYASGDEGYYWFPGYDLKPLDTPDLISLLTNTSCYPGSPCGSCRFNISAVGCGIDGGQFHGVSKLPKDCAVLCDSLAGCGCTSFVHDVTYSGTGCCYLKNATVASLTISPSYNAFVRKGSVDASWSPSPAGAPSSAFGPSPSPLIAPSSAPQRPFLNPGPAPASSYSPATAPIPSSGPAISPSPNVAPAPAPRIPGRFGRRLQSAAQGSLEQLPDVIASGYTWFPGYDLNPNSSNLIIPPPCTSDCGLCFITSGLRCGGGAGILLSPADCAQLCNKRVACGCSSFVHDSGSTPPGCCFLKNVTQPQIAEAPPYDAYVSNTFLVPPLRITSRTAPYTSGYTWMPGFDFGTNGSSLITTLSQTPCINFTSCGSCRVDNTSLCGPANNLGLLYTAKACAETCDRIADCGCNAFSWDARSSCCYLTSAPEPFLLGPNPGSDFYYRNSLAPNLALAPSLYPTSNQSAPGYTWIPGFDVVSNASSDAGLLPRLLRTSCAVASACGSCQVPNGTELCGPERNGTTGMTGMTVAGPQACAEVCDRLAGCNCTAFSYEGDPSRAQGCCHLTSAMAPLLAASARADSYISNNLANLTASLATMATSAPPPVSAPSPVTSAPRPPPPRAPQNVPVAAVEPASPSSKKGVIIGLSVGVSAAFGLALICALLALCVCRVRSKRRNEALAGYGGKGPVELSFNSDNVSGTDDGDEPNWYALDYEDLFSATGGFGEGHVISRGIPQRILYSGTLRDGREVDVLVFHGTADSAPSNSGGSFPADVRSLTRVHHRNLVRLRGCAQNGPKKVLVWDRCAIGCLAEALSGGGPPLNWFDRLRVAVDVARGLNYLHSEIVPPCIHQDVRSANVLLDEELNGVLTNFGVAAHLNPGGVDAREPIFRARAFDQATIAGDVSGFGRLLLELTMGLPALSATRTDGITKPLLHWFHEAAPTTAVGFLVDPQLGDAYSPRQAAFLLRLALLCLNPGQAQPSIPMGKVLSLLTELQHGGEPRVPPVEVSGLALYQQWFDAVNVNPGGFRMRRPEALEETQGSTVGHDFSLITEGR